jgi:predicted membrane-bound spermidine synthase
MMMMNLEQLVFLMFNLVSAVTMVYLMRKAVKYKDNRVIAIVVFIMFVIAFGLNIKQLIQSMAV